MLEIILLFTRAQRGGLLELHLHAFTLMLPFFFLYNHPNYARRGTVYISEMNHLPDPVKAEFDSGNFVVNRSAQTFNQVGPAQSQEWLNAVGKKGGGINVIMKTPSALSRWTLSFNLRSHLVSATKVVYRIERGDAFTCNESNPARQKIDLKDEDNLLNIFQSFNLFSADTSPDLRNIATKDIVTKNTEDDLLIAHQKIQDQLMQFVEERLLADVNRKFSHRDGLPKNKPLTFSSLFEVEQKQSTTSTKKVVQADRKFQQRLIIPFKDGRNVSLEQLLEHELMPAPPALAEKDSYLQSGQRSFCRSH